MDQHLKEVDEQMKRYQKWLNAHVMLDERYQQLTENIYIKIYGGMTTIAESLVRAILCRSNLDTMTTNKGQKYLDVLESYNKGFWRAMDVKVDEYSVCYDFLTDFVFKKQRYSGTVFKTDPLMFYYASHSFLTGFDRANQVVYFTVITPILLKRDISPLYKTSNIGWWEDDVNLRYDLLDHLYYLTDKTNQEEISSTDL